MIVAGFVGDVLRGENPDKLTSYYDAASSDDIQIVSSILKDARSVV